MSCRSGLAKGNGGAAGLQLAQAGVGHYDEVPREVVTGTRVPPDVTAVKPAIPAPDTVPWTTTQPRGGVTLRVPFPPVPVIYRPAVDLGNQVL